MTWMAERPENGTKDKVLNDDDNYWISETSAGYVLY
jgi:hypothetical protein